MVSLCWRMFLVLCGFVSRGRWWPPHWLIDLMVMVGFQSAQSKQIAAEKISWPTLADIQPTRGVQTCNIVFKITLAGLTCRPTCCERDTCECWPTFGRHAMQTQNVLFFSLWSFPCHIWCLIQHEWFPQQISPKWLQKKSVLRAVCHTNYDSS